MEARIKQLTKGQKRLENMALELIKPPRIKGKVYFYDSKFYDVDNLVGIEDLPEGSIWREYASRYKAIKDVEDFMIITTKDIGMDDDGEINKQFLLHLMIKYG